MPDRLSRKMIKSMRINLLFLLFLFACMSSNTVINLPDRTSVGKAPAHYDPCVSSYTQRAYMWVEEHICKDSMGNKRVEEYYDTIREYPCTWQTTTDGKSHCIPVAFSSGFFGAEIKKDIPFRDNYFAQCVDPIISLEADPFGRSRSWYVGIFQNGAFHVYEIGRLHSGNIYATFHSESWNEDYCDEIYPFGVEYPVLPKNYRWFHIGEEVDPALFQER